MISLYIAYCVSYSILGVLTVFQPFSQDKQQDDTSSAVVMCLLPATLSLTTALITMRICHPKQRKLGASTIAAAILSLILCIYAAVVPVYVQNNYEGFGYESLNATSGDYGNIYKARIDQ